MKQDNLEKIITEVNSVRIRDKVIPLVYTGVKNSGGFTSAFEFSNQETEEKYFLKVSEIAEGSKDETSTLTKVNLLFKKEILSEPDAAKRLNYMPVPDVWTDDIDKSTLNLCECWIVTASLYNFKPPEKESPAKNNCRIH